MFESTLWASRFMVISAVVFGLMGAVVLFIVASVDIYETTKFIWFFQKVGHTQYNGTLDMLYFALSITAVAVGLYFLGKVGKK